MSVCAASHLVGIPVGGDVLNIVLRSLHGSLKFVFARLPSHLGVVRFRAQIVQFGGALAQLLVEPFQLSLVVLHLQVHKPAPFRKLIDFF